MSEPKVSVIIPYFRSPDTLLTCLDSVLAQSYANIEIICVGEGVKDPAHAVAEYYAAECPAQIRLLRQQNGDGENARGGAAGRNLGLSVCTGDYIMFVDHDDRVEPCIIEQLLNAIIEQKADLACCGFDRVHTQSGRRISKENAITSIQCEKLSEPEMRRLAFLFPAPWGKLYPRSLIGKNRFSERLPMAGEDLAFFLPLAQHVRRVVTVPGVLYHHMVHGKNTTLHFNSESYAVFLENFKQLQGNMDAKSNGAQNYLTLAAFIHVGIALVHRVTQNNSMSYAESISRSREFLDAHFPDWRKIGPLPDGRITLRGLAVYIVKLLYIYGGVGMFMRCYNAAIRFTGRDLKW